MFTITLFTVGAALIGFFGGTAWLATSVLTVVLAKLFPMVTVCILGGVIGLVAVKYKLI